MFTTIVVGTALIVSVAQQTDTVIAVQRGTRLELRNQQGEIRVRAWNRDEIRITTDRARGGAFTVERSGAVVRVNTVRGRWRSSTDRRRDRYEWQADDDVVNYAISVPPYVALSLRGNESDIYVSGTAADITAETADGAIEVQGGNGRIILNSVDQSVRVTGARGVIDIEASDGNVFVRDVTGDLRVTSVDGDIALVNVDSRNVEAVTVDGDVSLEGTIITGGRYYLSTHDGDVVLYVPENVNADVIVYTFEGGFEASFPVVLRETRRKRLHFALGSGGADVRLETFGGDVYLRRR